MHSWPEEESGHLEEGKAKKIVDVVCYIMISSILPQSLIPRTTCKDLEDIKLKFIDTSSKFGHGRFQSGAEKIQFMVSRVVNVVCL